MIFAIFKHFIIGFIILTVLIIGASILAEIATRIDRKFCTGCTAYIVISILIGCLTFFVEKEMNELDSYNFVITYKNVTYYTNDIKINPDKSISFIDKDNHGMLIRSNYIVKNIEKKEDDK